MTDKLDPDDYIPYAPTELGKTVRRHHCRGGRGKDKLYITRKEDGTIAAFCHHCHASGRTSVADAQGTDYISGSVYSNSNRKSEASRGNKNFAIPHDCEGNTDKWGAEALEWAEQYLTKDEIDDSPLSYSVKEGALIFPFVTDSDMVMYQARYFPVREPKYMTYWNPNADRQYNPMGQSDTLVITEDWISAYKCTLAGYAAYPLAGSHLSKPSLAGIIARDYGRYVVALDNDNPAVRKEQRRLERELSAYAPTLVLKLTKDLKCYGLPDIKDLIDEDIH